MLSNVWILWGEITCWTLLGVTGLKKALNLIGMRQFTLSPLSSFIVFLLQFLKHYFLAKALKWHQINYKSRNYNLKAEVSRWNQIYCNFSIGLNEGVKWVLGIYASLLQWNGNPPLPSLTFPISQLIGQKSPLWQRLNKFITRDKAKLNK